MSSSGVTTRSVQFAEREAPAPVGANVPSRKVQTRCGLPEEFTCAEPQACHAKNRAARSASTPGETPRSPKMLSRREEATASHLHSELAMWRPFHRRALPFAANTFPSDVELG